MLMMNQLGHASQDANDSIDREFRLGSLRDDHTLAVATTSAWISEALPKGASLADCISGAFKLFFKGSWRKHTRHCTANGKAGDGRNIAVRVHPADD